MFDIHTITATLMRAAASATLMFAAIAHAYDPISDCDPTCTTNSDGEGDHLIEAWPKPSIISCSPSSAMGFKLLMLPFKASATNMPDRPIAASVHFSFRQI